MSSLGNFCVLLFILHVTSIGEFGAFSIAYAYYFLCLNIARSLVLEPYLIRHSARDITGNPEAGWVAVDAALTLGVLAALVSGILVAPFQHALPLRAILTMAVIVPGLLYQDAWRYFHFSQGRPSRALLTDTIWTATLLIGLTIVLLVGTQGEAALIAATLAWGASGLIAAIVESVYARHLPSLIGAPAVIRSYADLGARYSIEFIVERGAGQIGIILVGALAGLQAVGAITAGRTALAPVTTLYSGVAAYAMAEGARVHRDGALNPRSFAARHSLVLGGVAILVGVALAVVPHAVATRAFGDNWASARAVLLPIVIFVGAAGVSEGPRCTLRILQAAKATLRARSLVALLVLIGASLGAVAYGAEGAAWGMAGGSLVGALLWWAQLLATSGPIRLLSEPDLG